METEDWLIDFNVDLSPPTLFHPVSETTLLFKVNAENFKDCDCSVSLIYVDYNLFVCSEVPLLMDWDLPCSLTLWG